jgi:OOP family OmpA-OmpF porin
MIAPQLKKALIFACALLCEKTVFAQQMDVSQTANPFPANSEFRSWSLGLSGGLISQYTVFLGNADFKTPTQSAGYGLYIKKQIVPTFGIQADFLGGNVTGKTALSQSGVNSPYSRYNTQISWSGALSINLTIINLNWRDSQSRLQLYSTLGGGLMSYKASLFDYSDVKTEFNPATHIFIPIGIGLKFGISRSINIDLGYRVNFIDADIVDGYLYGSNNDKFSYSHLGLEFALGKSSKPKLAGHNAAPSMRNEYIAGISTLQKQVNILQAKNDSIQAQLTVQKTQNARLESIVTSTTTDSDGDGVADKFDKCPNTPAGSKIDGSGCPLPKMTLSIAEKKVVDDVIQRLEFQLKKSDIQPSSFASLDSLAHLILTKKAKLKIDGYTDNTGPDWRNLALSNNRANAVKKYLIKKGVDPESITATGYGNTNPIASNETLEGRKQNRRVEFTLY